MKCLVLLLTCVIVLSVSAVFAQPLPTHSSEIATSISYLYYKEPSVMKERGMMYGVAGDYAYHNTLMLKAQARAAFGQIDYKGTGTINDINEYLLELRGLAGLDCKVFESTALTPYIGFGFRYLNDDSSGQVSTTGKAGYERESHYFYSPVGIETSVELENNWSLGAAAEYDIFWWGTQLSHLGDVPGYDDSKNRQNKGYGVRGSVALRKKERRMDFSIEPYAIYWNIKSSKVSTQGVEPKNHSIECGIKLAIGF